MSWPRGCRHRQSASTPDSRPERMSKIGWYRTKSSSRNDGRARSPSSASLLTTASCIAGSKNRNVLPPAFFASYIAMSAWRRISAGPEVAMPIDALTTSSCPAAAIGCRSVATIRSAIVCRVAAFDEERELVAADARDDVGRLHDLAQAFGDRSQQLVACGVPKAVVHRLEVVEVEVEERRRRAAAALGEQALEPRAVPQAGERIRVRESLELVARLALCGDVEDVALPLDRIAVGVGDRGRLVANPDDPAVRAHDAVLAADLPVLRRLDRHLLDDAVEVVRVQDAFEE